MTQLLLIAAGLLSFYGYIPYMRDILRGKVQPARSARLMFALLLIVTLLQQHDLHSGWLVIFTATEAAGSLMILLFALKYGIGGFTKLDKACYLLLVIDLAVWLSTGNTLLALHLSVLADLIAFTPTLAKTFRQPWTETPFFFITGIIAPILNMLGAHKYSYAVLLFPCYIAFVNAVEVGLIVVRQQQIPKPGRRRVLDSEGPTRL